MPTALVATYRLQLARAGSTHGYDVTDPTQVSDALGGDEAFVALAETAHEHDMGIVLDIVPNHMGVGPDNPYWDDLLAHGRGSRYADWFDVAWRAPTKRLSGKVLVPVLDDTLEKVLARGEITLDASDEGVRVRYYSHSFPIDPATLPPELERTLLGEWRHADEALARARLAFVLRWQQLTGPAAAKGIEDTALYIYAPPTSRNEVGGDPGLPVEDAVKRLRDILTERAERHPRSLNATNTHDTKRSADARARIDALSEHADEWERALRRWHRMHRSLRVHVNGRFAPTRAVEDFIYQAAVGIWPLSARHSSIRTTGGASIGRSVNACSPRSKHSKAQIGVRNCVSGATP